MKTCPHCLTELKDRAEVCAACGRQIVGKPCPECDEIAGFHYHAGWFWDAVEIQTRGQKANWIGCLPKASGARVKELLERMKE